MRITFVLPTANMSGGIRVVAIYAQKLSDMGHDVVLVSPPQKQLSFKDKIKFVLRNLKWPTTEPIVSHIDNVNVSKIILNKWRPVDDSDIPNSDIVIATWWETAEWVLNLSQGKGAKVYFIQHHEVHKYLPIERCKATYEFPMHKIVIARWLQRIMKEDYGDTSVDLVPNSVDHQLFFAAPRNKQSTPTVGFLYSHSQYKGVDITISVIRKLREFFPELRVLTFGACSPEDRETEMKDFEFHFSPSQDYIREIYSQCDIWITASRTEGFNLPAMEAMACRTPVVSTQAGWPEEAIINGENGALAKVDDINALVGYAREILSLNNESWQTMSNNAYLTVKDSSWDSSADLFEKSLVNACVRAKQGEISGSCKAS